MIDRICFTGSNLVEVSAFLGPYHFEYTGERFLIPSPLGDIVLNKGDSLIKKEDGSLELEKAVVDIWPAKIEKEKKTRGKKK